MKHKTKRNRRSKSRRMRRTRHNRHNRHTRRMRGGAFVNQELEFQVQLQGIMHDEAGNIGVGDMLEPFDDDVRDKIINWYTMTTQRLINNGTLQHIQNIEFVYENNTFKVRFEYDDEHENERDNVIDLLLNHWEIIEELPDIDNIPEIIIDGVHWYPEKLVEQNVNQNNINQQN